MYFFKGYLPLTTWPKSADEHNASGKNRQPQNISLSSYYRSGQQGPADTSLGLLLVTECRPIPHYTYCHSIYSYLQADSQHISPSTSDTRLGDSEPLTFWNVFKLGAIDGAAGEADHTMNKVITAARHKISHCRLLGQAWTTCLMIITGRQGCVNLGRLNEPPCSRLCPPHCKKIMQVKQLAAGICNLT